MIRITIAYAQLLKILLPQTSPQSDLTTAGTRALKIDKYRNLLGRRSVWILSYNMSFQQTHHLDPLLLVEQKYLYFTFCEITMHRIHFQTFRNLELPGPVL